MSAARWECENEQSSTLTCIPVDLVENMIIVWLQEEDAFRVRGTCFHFYTAYFGQNYRHPNRGRVFALVSKGRVYRKLSSYNLYKPKTADLSPLSGLPALRELVIVFRERVCNNLETFPCNLNQLRELQLEGNVRDLSSLRHSTELRNLCLWTNGMLDLLTIPFELVWLESLALNNCGLKDLSQLSYLSSFLNLNTLELSHCEDMVLATIPNNLSQILTLHIDDCSLSDLSPLSRLPLLKELNVSSNKDLQLETIPDCLSQLVKLCIGNCRIRSISSLARFPTLMNIFLEDFSVDLRTIPYNLTHLTTFTLGMRLSRQRTFSTLGRFASLEEIHLSYCMAIDLESLPTNLTHLKKLSLKNCNLRNVFALNRFPTLEECDLSNNEGIIVDTIPSNLRRLRILCLRGCDLEDVILSKFSCFPDLRQLDLRHNSLNINSINESFHHILIRT